MATHTGFSELEKLMGGFQPGGLTVLAVPPAMGATAFCLGMMAAPNGKGNILYLSLSATTERILLRLKTTGLVAEQDGQNPDLLRIIHGGRKHTMLYHEFPKPIELLEILADAASHHLPDLFIINDLTFIGRKQRRIFDPKGRHHRILRLLKTMAVALQRPILLIATIIQDSAEKRKKTIAGLAAREPFADNIIVMHRYDYYDEQTDDFDLPVERGDTDFRLLKSRRMLGTFRLRLSDENWMFGEVKPHGSR